MYVHNWMWRHTHTHTSAVRFSTTHREPHDDSACHAFERMLKGNLSNKPVLLKRLHDTIATLDCCDNRTHHVFGTIRGWRTANYGDAPPFKRFSLCMETPYHTAQCKTIPDADNEEASITPRNWVGRSHNRLRLLFLKRKALCGLLSVT
jgi:hypothetical protein